MVGHRHELGQGWIPEDGIVWQVDVGDIKVNELGAIVVAGLEGDREVEPPPTTEKGLEGWSRLGGTWSRPNAFGGSTLRLAPPSMRVLVIATW